MNIIIYSFKILEKIFILVRDYFLEKLKTIMPLALQK